MNNLKLLFKNKISIIVAVLLASTLLIGATFASTYAKYVKSQKVGLNLSVLTGMPSLTQGPTGTAYIRDGIYNAIIKVDNGYGNKTNTLNAVKQVNIIQTPQDVSGLGTLVEKGSTLLTESGATDIYWNKETGVFTICSTQPIYANKNCSQMFQYMTGVENVDLSNLHTDNTTDMSGMFDGCDSLTGFSLANLNTENVVNIKGMFNGCSSITSAGFSSDCDVDFTGLPTENLRFGYDNLFSECVNLQRVDLSGFKSTKQDKYGNVFYGCTSLTDINFGESFFSPAGNNFTGMFQGCTSLAEIDLSTFNKSALTNVGVYFTDMFRGCSALTELDLTKFNTANVVRFIGMFRDCSNLKTINFGDNFTTGTVTNFAVHTQHMFNGCSSLESLEGLQLHLNKVQGLSTEYNYGLEAMFKNCAKLKEINFASPYTSVGTNVSSVSSMFEGCESLTTLDLTGFATEDFKITANMFKGCTNLKEIKCVDAEDATKFSTAQVTHSAGMFSGCSSLISLASDFSLDLSGVNTAVYLANNGNRTNVVGQTNDMFSDCASLTELIFEAGITSNVTDVSGMFKGCIGLTDHTIDLTGFDFTNITESVDGYGELFAGYNSSSLTVKRPAGTWKAALETTPGGAAWAGVTFTD